MNAQSPIVERTATPLPVETRPITRRKFLWSGMGLLTLTGAGGAGYSYFEASQRLRVTSYNVISPRWTSGQRLTITVITDLHAAGGAEIVILQKKYAVIGSDGAVITVGHRTRRLPRI